MYMYMNNEELGPSIFEELNKNILRFAEYILFTPDEGFYMLLKSGWRGTKCVNYFSLIFKFVIPQISYSVLIKT